MIVFIKHLITSDFLDFLGTLTSVTVVFVSGIIMLEPVKKSRGSKQFWGLVYGFTGFNVIIWTLALC